MVGFMGARTIAVNIQQKLLGNSPDIDIPCQGTNVPALRWNAQVKADHPHILCSHCMLPLCLSVVHYFSIVFNSGLVELIEL